MTEPSQYFKGRTVQEQMDEVIGYVDVRSAEVATTAIASDVAQVHQDMLDADADASAAAASAAAAAGTLANAVKKTGEASQSIAGDIAVAGNLSGGSVTVPAPVNNTDAASKKYVDDADATKISITNINAYAVGLTGTQGPISGLKTFSNAISIDRTGIQAGLRLKRSDIHAGSETVNKSVTYIQWLDGDNTALASLNVVLLPAGNARISVACRNTDGTLKELTLLTGDVI